MDDSPNLWRKQTRPDDAYGDQVWQRFEAFVEYSIYVVNRKLREFRIAVVIFEVGMIGQKREPKRHPHNDTERVFDSTSANMLDMLVA